MGAPGTRRVSVSAKGDLSRYREKRDFAKTPEPRGKRRARAEKARRFVIQKHAARRLHYDLRLELDGVFKSWAVARGPSLDPHQKRLAIQVEDHPLDYGDFEGVIPKGEYGAGAVMIWDRGLWKPEGDPGAAYKKGHLAFELEGEKLKGRWHLVRTKPRPGRKNAQWLLLKADDEAARSSGDGDILEEEAESAASGRTIGEIAEEKDAVWSSLDGGLVVGELSPARAEKSEAPRARRLRKSAALQAGGDGRTKTSHVRRNPTGRSGAAAIKGAKKAGFPGFTEPCLALLRQKAPEGDGWLHEIKFDGYRVIALVEKGRPTLMTRGGLDWTHRFPAIADAFLDLPAASAIVDGEAVVVDKSGASDFSALQQALAGGPAEEAIYYAFDLLYLDGYDLREAKLDARKDALETLLAGKARAALHYSEHVAGEGPAMAEHACRLGLEGIVSKRRNAPYRAGRHGEWVKIKCSNRAEFVIGGYAPSTAARGAIGSLALGYYEDARLIYVGRAGTGFTQKSAHTLYEQLRDPRTPEPAFANALTAAEKRGLVFVEPKLVAEVAFRGWTGDRRLRAAAFKGLREDKPASEVRLELAAPASAKGEGQTAVETRFAMGGGAEFEGVKLTHPDRVLWEEQGLTKLGLAEYYAEIADYILPHIAGRPLALLRCPNGAGGECFFQKHAFAGLTGAVEVAHAPQKEGEEETLVIRDLRGLITLVQADVLEIHPWGCRIEDVEHPDRLIFDLDPGADVEWGLVVEGAREVRQRLLDRGLESYVKTTGGKGLHVVVPLASGPSWKEIKDFAHKIAHAMEADTPARYIATMSKKDRGGKIFVDYLRNSRGATAVAAYSTRARANAPVSTPIGWHELGRAINSSHFNTANLPRRLSALKSDPWAEFFSAPQVINLCAHRNIRSH